jgi:hypothetical protein
MHRCARVAAVVGMLAIVSAAAAPRVPALVLADDCPLVPTVDAGDAIGISLKLSTPPLTITKAHRVSVTCTWDVQELYLTSALSAQLTKGPTEKAKYAKARRHAPNPVAVSGLGQKAFWAQASGRLVVLIDATTVVTIVHPDPTTSGGAGYRAASEAIATLVIARL